MSETSSTLDANQLVLALVAVNRVGTDLQLPLDPTRSDDERNELVAPQVVLQEEREWLRCDLVNQTHRVIRVQNLVNLRQQQSGVE